MIAGLILVWVFGCCFAIDVAWDWRLRRRQHHLNAAEEQSRIATEALLEWQALLDARDKAMREFSDVAWLSLNTDTLSMN